MYRLSILNFFKLPTLLKCHSSSYTDTDFVFVADITGPEDCPKGRKPFHALSATIHLLTAVIFFRNASRFLLCCHLHNNFIEPLFLVVLKTPFYCHHL